MLDLRWSIGFFAAMDGHLFWMAQPYRCITGEPAGIEPFSEGCENDGGPFVSIDAILPDDMLEKIFAYLPIASIFRAASVCKRWHEIVKSRRFLWNFSNVIMYQKPWYFMFTCNEIAEGYTYDPILRKWYGGISLPCIESSSWIVAASCGLVCFMDNDGGSKMYVCNPITKRWRGLGEPPGMKHSCYSSLAISVDRKSHNYSIIIAKSMQVPGDFLQWDFSIDVYNSEVGSWVTCVEEVFNGWRAGDESAICDGVLYCLIYSSGVLRHSELRHALIMHDLSEKSPCASLLKTLILAPCPLTCGRLMNLKERLILVGGIGKQDRADIIKGIGIWELVDKRTWREVSRMPHRFFQGFGEFDDVFASSGTDDLIYIQSYGSPALLVFDMSQKQWKWALKCPVNKRFPLQLFTGFCFEPRLEVSP